MPRWKCEIDRRAGAEAEARGRPAPTHGRVEDSCGSGAGLVIATPRLDGRASER